VFSDALNTSKSYASL